MYGLDQGRFTVAAGACGVVRASLPERSVEYARERETFGQPIGKYQFVQDMIADMVLGYEIVEAVRDAGGMDEERGPAQHPRDVTAKWHATESAFKAAHLAIQVHGAYGYSAEYGIERYFPKRAGADHLRGHNPDPQDDAGRARAGLPKSERAGRRRLAARLWAPALVCVHRAGPAPTGA